eukprot:3276036-Amphidinium_carterae.1
MAQNPCKTPPMAQAQGEHRANVNCSKAPVGGCQGCSRGLLLLEAAMPHSFNLLRSSADGAFASHHCSSNGSRLPLTSTRHGIESRGQLRVFPILSSDVKWKSTSNELVPLDSLRNLIRLEGKDTREEASQCPRKEARVEASASLVQLCQTTPGAFPHDNSNPETGIGMEALMMRSIPFTLLQRGPPVRHSVSTTLTTNGTSMFGCCQATTARQDQERK